MQPLNDKNILIFRGLTNLNQEKMAKPIKETPFLYGKDARNFIQQNKTVEKVSREEREEIKRNANTLKSIAEFGI